MLRPKLASRGQKLGGLLSAKSGSRIAIIRSMKADLGWPAILSYPTTPYTVTIRHHTVRKSFFMDYCKTS